MAKIAMKQSKNVRGEQAVKNKENSTRVGSSPPGSQIVNRALALTLITLTALVPLTVAIEKAYSQSTSSQCKIEVRQPYRYITSNGIPDHATGQFPNRGNPNTISAQDYHFKVPLNPTPGQGQSRGYDFGVAVNGVPFDPGTAELWNGDMRWHYEALSGMMVSRGSLGVDANLAHVQPNGAYHYHGLPMGLLEKLNYRSKMVLAGYAADGYPIYGPYCYSTANDSRSALKKMKSSYRLKSGTRIGAAMAPAEPTTDHLLKTTNLFKAQATSINIMGAPASPPNIQAAHSIMCSLKTGLLCPVNFAALPMSASPKAHLA
jgi:hypothetical protein